MRGHRFSRPCGTDLISDLFPALKSRAIFKKSLWDFGLLAALVWFLAVGAAAAETTNTLSDAEIQGRQLAQQLCNGQPTENLTNTGVLEIRDRNGKRTTIPVKFKVILTSSNWQSLYSAKFLDQTNEITRTRTGNTVVISHKPNSENHYEEVLAFSSVNGFSVGPNGISKSTLLESETLRPFVNSDFWLCDLGLEFFHWPAQKVLPKTTNLKRSREYTLLESTNPNPPTNGYSRVRSWIDKETGGILEAEAYDFNGKLLKDFAPKSFKKVNGQWELQEMEIRNVQTGSRTRLEFDLKK